MDNRERITEEAAGLFMKFGIRRVTMDSLASHIGISKRTIYENFADKDALLISVIQSMVGKQKKLFFDQMAKSENVIEVIFNILKIASGHFQNADPSFLTDLRKYHYKVYERIINKSDIRNYEMSMALLKRGVEEKIFRSDLNIEIVNAGIHGFMDLTRSSEYFPTGRFDRREVLDNLLFNYLRGISTKNGCELIDKYRNQIKF